MGDDTADTYGIIETIARQHPQTPEPAPDFVAEFNERAAKMAAGPMESAARDFLDATARDLGIPVALLRGDPPAGLDPATLARSQEVMAEATTACATTLQGDWSAHRESAARLAEALDAPVEAVREGVVFWECRGGWRLSAGMDRWANYGVDSATPAARWQSEVFADGVSGAPWALLQAWREHLGFDGGEE